MYMPQLIDNLSQPDTYQLIDIIIVNKYLGNKVMKTKKNTFDLSLDILFYII